MTTEWPLPDDASMVMDISGTINFQTGLSVDDVIEFYRTEFDALGYTERTILTSISDDGFSLVFDGHDSGIPIVLQGFPLTDDLTNVSIRLEEA